MGVILYTALAAGTVLAAAAAERTRTCRAGTRGALLRRTALVLLALILIVPAALRQETGNDYLRYVEFFHLASIDSYVPTEAGFNLLVKALYLLCGYENYLLIFGVFSVWTIGNLLLVVWRQAEDFTFSFFLFMMFGYYFQSFNTVRYYLALSITLLAMICILRKQYVGFMLLVLFAALFHKSALVALVLYPLSLHKWTHMQRGLAIAAGGLALVFHQRVLDLLVALYPSWEGTRDLAAGTSISWVNIGRCAAVLLLAVLVQRWRLKAGREADTVRTLLSAEATECCRDDGDSAGVAVRSDDALAGRELRMYINGSFLALLLYVFGWFIPEVSRICYYLTFTQIFLIPMLLARIPEDAGMRIVQKPQAGAVKRQNSRIAQGTEQLKCKGKEAFLSKDGACRRLLTALAILGAGLYFAFFLKTAYRDTIKILPYKTFLFHDLNQTPSGSVGKN